MWILFRIVILCAGFYLRYANVFRKRFDFKAKLHSRTGYSIVDSKHKGKTVEYCLAVELKSDTVFKISRETKANRILKAAGFASEIQTGDTAFDGQYYVGSDHRIFNQALCGDSTIRNLIHDIITKNPSVDSIICDGQALYVTSKTEIDPHDDIVEMLQKFSEKIKSFASTSRFQAYNDPYFYKLLVFESVFWALLGYAFEAYIELMIADRLVLYSPFKVFIPGFVTGLAIAGLLGFLFFKFFQDSARSHYILIGNLTLVLIGSPFWGTKTFVDLNRLFDKSAVQAETIRIVRKEVRVHRSNKGGTSYTYHFHLSTPDASGRKALQVSTDVFASAEQGNEVEIKSRSGAFGYPYRISVNNIEL